jgi:hypothetical protein
VERLIGSYADDGRAATHLKSGEGLLRQCARDHQSRQMEVGGDLSITSGLGNHRPTAVLMAPLLLGTVLSVGAGAWVASITGTNPPSD